MLRRILTVVRSSAVTRIPCNCCSIHCLMIFCTSVGRRSSLPTSKSRIKTDNWCQFNTRELLNLKKKGTPKVCTGMGSCRKCTRCYIHVNLLLYQSCILVILNLFLWMNRTWNAGTFKCFLMPPSCSKFGNLNSQRRKWLLKQISLLSLLQQHRTMIRDASP